MQPDKVPCVLQQNDMLFSRHLNREVKIDLYVPRNVSNFEELRLLLINDGQDLKKMDFQNILESLYHTDKIEPLICAGIHCGADRKNEYATAKFRDYKGRGKKAQGYTKFIFKELLPFLKGVYSASTFKEKSFCGFSLGALSALDIVWNHPEEFTKVGLFSGAFWWRSLSQDNILFDEAKHRIMHKQIREGGFFPWLTFFFETGTLDETADRNNNGVIDSIDDTVSLIDELVLKGYNRERDIKYFEIKDGAHNIQTWAKAFPEFLIWGWGRQARGYGQSIPNNLEF